MRLIDGDYLYNKLVANKCPYDLVLQMVKDEPTVCDIEQIKIKIIAMSCRYSLARERGCGGQVEWSDRLIKVDDVLKVFEEYQKGGKE